jgi:uncharacterized membrane protein YdbT with pleckstrin-like domain
VAFPRRLVYDDETVVVDLHPHWWYFSRYLLTGVALLALVVLTANIESPDVRNVVRWPVGLLALVWAVWLTGAYLRWLRTYFVVTDQRVLYRRGVLGRRGVEIPLDRISNLDYRQGLWERLIGVGTLVVESAGEDSDTRFDNVKHPDDVQNEIYRQMEGVARRTAGAGADALGDAVARAVQARLGTAAGGDVAAKIEQLARLRDEGHISPTEFERRKNRLLDAL